MLAQLVSQPAELLAAIKENSLIDIYLHKVTPLRRNAFNQFPVSQVKIDRMG